MNSIDKLGTFLGVRTNLHTIYRFSCDGGGYGKGLGSVICQ